MYPRANTEEPSLLQRFINEFKLEEKNVPLTELRQLEGTNKVVLGVDGTKIMDTITQTVRDREKVSIYTSTIPVTAYEKITEISNMLLMIKDCTPVMVFNGIPFYPDTQEQFARDKDKGPIPSEALLLNGLDESRLCNMTPGKAADIQKKTSGRFNIEEDVDNRIMKLFRATIKDTMRAPYLAWAQLSAFSHPANCVLSEVYGCLELLAFPSIDRVVTNINITKGTFDMVRKVRILEMLKIPEDDFDSLVVIDSRNKIMKPAYLKFSSFEDMIRRIPRQENYTLGSSFVYQMENDSRMSEAQRQRNYGTITAVSRNLAALSCPVLTLFEPYCVPLSVLYGMSNRQIPVATKAAIGGRLPTIIYYMLSAGILSPSLVAVLSQDCIVDDWPLVDSVKYRDVAEVFLPLRVQTLCQITNAMHPDNTRPMSWFRRYNVSNGRLSKINRPPDITLDQWDVANLVIPGDLCLSDVLVYSNLAVLADDIQYTTKEQTRAAVLLQSLDLLGYFTHDTPPNTEKPVSDPSIYGKALSICGVGSLSEYAVLLIELTRTKSLTAEPLRISPENIQRTSTPAVSLASRVLSLIPLNLARPWTGPLDPELAAFSMVSRMMSRALRHLLEANMAVLFYKRITTVPLHLMSEIEETLPFITPVEFSAGLLVQYILMKPGCTLNDLHNTFPECTYLRDDLSTLFYFWQLAVGIMKLIGDKEGVGVDRVVIEEANAMMVESWNNFNLTAMNDGTY